MGYRHYMFIVPRDLVDNVKNLTYDELKEFAKAHNAFGEYDDEEWVLIHELLGRNEFHCFGKYYENADNVEALGKPLFSNPDTQEYFAYYRPYVIGIDAVMCAIEGYRKEIVKWYNKLLKTQEEYDASCEPWERGRLKQEDRIKQHLESQKEEWENRFGLSALDLDMNSPRIVRSWLYEYEIFELVHQMKMMDWEKNTLVFYGY